MITPHDYLTDTAKRYSDHFSDLIGELEDQNLEDFVSGFVDAVTGWEAYHEKQARVFKGFSSRVCDALTVR